ncbi:winged helix-turn-helix transcriptional regulator [Amycolatopsis sp. CA-230715]|uniref:winged helix-turn-helix transcriptional regulator n=1 Tax=Amycolatopsis sp. CA-230715 TaxID=2745196 RepID=UPI001C01F8DE|nr:helix-turn-helix domain-containing protein [Amycolatopsis sp. CA-230715]QWF80998.1 hypothetical protein HUW46_04423 [Amycolatopsis sp. CA-230715]
MTDLVPDEDIPYRQAVLEGLRVTRGDWTVAVLSTLALGKLAYSDIVDSVNATEDRIGWRSHDRPLSNRVLTNTLRRLEEDNLVARTEKGGRGRTFDGVDYQLTEAGQELLIALRPLASWAEKYRGARSSTPKA